MSTSLPRYVIIPAAGIGSRMSSDIPKQYLKLVNNHTVLDTTLSKFVEEDFFDLIIVSLKENDEYWKLSQYFNHPKVKVCKGGETRFESVFNALHSLAAVHNDAWIFVHDAARPAISFDEIKLLYDQVLLGRDESGILAVKAFETVKKVSQKVIKETLDRSHIWLAQTPQLSRYNTLKRAFKFCVDNNLMEKITDESSALELFGLSPIIVEGSRKNIKITTKEDLEFINFFI
ncbi:2-C-methyl-D-erythritol 4-phosphate cytidylyltransferase [Francisella adeliensis]|nr:2-C-methyl-D-erythritol 4-phosphate cytidylyltransferase [Francisella adeliensis]